MLISGALNSRTRILQAWGWDRIKKIERGSIMLKNLAALFKKPLLFIKMFISYSIFRSSLGF